MNYLDMLKYAPPLEVPPLDGVSALGDLKPEAGASLPHPWKGRLVRTPKGRGRLGWTDGERAAVCPHDHLALMVDLADVRLACDGHLERDR